MSNIAFDTLVSNYPGQFTDNWSRDGRAWVNYSEPAFVIYQGDTLHQNTIDDSNVETIYQELVGEFPHEVHRKSRPYVEELYVHVGDLESNEELAECVLEILVALDDYPVFDESHYCELEHERLVEYMHDGFVTDLAHELGRDDDEELAQWVHDNVENIWDHYDGSVDDVPFNVEDIAKLVS